jgi:putative transposase
VLHVQRKSKWNLQETVNAIFYLTKNGCMWRDLPEEFPPWQTVYWCYAKWVRDGTWGNINRSLVADNRLSNDKKFQPAVAIIDSQSSKDSSTCTQQAGIDVGLLCCISQQL